jgi:hypothetical protein
MALFVLVLLLAIVVLSAFGWVADSRDGADWRPTDAGRRVPRGGAC